MDALLAGAASGLIADSVTHPLSTVKTRIQVQRTAAQAKVQTQQYRGVAHAMRSIIRSEGPGALYRGIGAVYIGAAPSTALYFLSMEYSKKWLNKDAANPAPWASFVTGCLAQLAGSLAWVPMDVVKERMQVEGQVNAGERAKMNAVRATAAIVRSEGLFGLYRAFWVHQLSWMPYNGVYIAAYDFFQGAQKELFGEADGNVALFRRSLTSAFGGATVASVLTAPLDLVKTRLQVASANPELFPYNGVVACVRHTFATEGAMAFMDGVFARVAWMAPRGAIAMASFEVCKRLIRDEAASGEQA